MDLNQDEIHLWFCHDQKIIDSALLQRYYDVLNDAEKEQQNRFHFAKHRHQYLITRAMLRNVLSIYVDDVSPDQWEFSSNQYGKPYIKAPIAKSLYFNLSHTNGVIVLGVTKYKEIGVDVESILRKAKSLEVADRFFSPSEVAELHSLSESQQTDRFYDLWTLKEAYIKACGMGLSIPLDKFSFQFPNSENIDIKFDTEINDDAHAWKFWLFKTSEEYKVALAIKNNNPAAVFNISVREFISNKNFSLVNWACLRSLAINSANQVRPY